MNSYSILLLLFISTISSCKKETIIEPAKQIPSSGLYATMVYNDSDILKIDDIPYTTRPNYSNLQYTSEQTKSLEINQATLTAKMDIYVPPNASVSQKQPLLIMIHGGGYSNGDKDAWSNEAYTYSRAGYVCASLNYRLTQNGGNQDPALRLYAVQCALEDIQNGIRFLKKNANIYFVDTSRIVVFGGSAGGGLSLANAIEYDAQFATNDHPGFSSKTNGSISTGASLINSDPASLNGSLHYDAFDSPVLMFHAKEFDSGTGFTWSANALPTQATINNSGNSCSLYPQPNMTHTVVLEFDGEYWYYISPFLWEHLRLSEL